MLETEVIRTLSASPSDAGPRMTRTPEALKSGRVTLGIFLLTILLSTKPTIYMNIIDKERFVSIRYTLYHSPIFFPLDQKQSNLI